MLPTMSGTEAHLHLLPAILRASDATLYAHLARVHPFFALAATLTLYAHEVPDYRDIARLFDFLLANEAVVSLYLFATVIQSRKAELLDVAGPDEPDVLHSILSKLPQPVDWELLIRDTVSLFHHQPPERLPGHVWFFVSSHSVLKTTRSLRALSQQTLHDGQRSFAKEAAEIRRRDIFKARRRALERLIRRHRRPVLWSAVAVVVALGGMYVGRNSGSSSLLNTLARRVVEMCQRHL